jgi:TPP-dependent 2-oxoacid decarboxylase
MDAVNAAGVDKIFGVPGDFNLAFLDDIISHDQVEWIGNTNELRLVRVQHRIQQCR